MGSRENQLKQQVLALCGRLDIPATRHQSGELRVGARRVILGDAGWPDIVGVLPDGRFLAIETKTPTGRVEDTQVETLTRLHDCRAVVIIGDDFDEIARELTAVVTACRAMRG